MPEINEYSKKLAHWRSIGNTMSHSDFQIISDGSLLAEDSGIAFSSAEGEKHYIPIKGTQSINIYSNVTIDGKLLQYARENRIFITVFDRTGRVIGRFVPDTCSSGASTFLSQALLYADSETRLDLAKKFVIAECHMLQHVLCEYAHEEVVGKIGIVMAQARVARDYETLLLKEAKARALYYSSFDSIIGNSVFCFGKRSRRPPENEVNALISFGNAVLYNHISNEICKTSLDVRIGYLHATNNRSESLNLDFAELFKPLMVDRLVFRLVNNGMVEPSGFIYDGKSCFLSRDTKAIYIDAFQNVMNHPADKVFGGDSFRKIIQAEIRDFRRFVDGMEDYVPLVPTREVLEPCS